MGRFELISGKLQCASDTFAESDDRRQTVETQYQSTGDKIETLERQGAEAKKIAEDSDARCEEIVRKLVLAEHHRDRAEERAARSDGKIAGLESELGGVNKTMKSLSSSGDENGKREEDLEEEIKVVKERFRDAEVKAEMAERTVQKLQTEIDRMENSLMAEKGRSPPRSPPSCPPRGSPSCPPRNSPSCPPRSSPCRSSCGPPSRSPRRRSPRPCCPRCPSLCPD